MNSLQENDSVDAVYVLQRSDIYKTPSISRGLIPPSSSLITHKNEGDGVVTLSILWLNSEMASLAWDSHYSKTDTNRWVREQSVSGEPGLMGRPQQQLQSRWWRAFSLSCRVVRARACVFAVLCDSYECPFVNKQTEDTWPCPRMHFSTSPLLCSYRLSSGMDLLSERTESQHSSHWYSHLNMNDAHDDADGFNQWSLEDLRSNSSLISVPFIYMQTRLMFQIRIFFLNVKNDSKQ